MGFLQETLIEIQYTDAQKNNSSVTKNQKRTLYNATQRITNNTVYKQYATLGLLRVCGLREFEKVTISTYQTYCTYTTTKASPPCDSL